MNLGSRIKLARKSNGISILNTAFSRAKKQLIIVCDREAWKNKPQELLGYRANTCSEYPIPSSRFQS